MCAKSLHRVKFMNALCEAQHLIRELGGGSDVRPQLGMRTAFRRILDWCKRNERSADAFSHNRVRDCWHARRAISVSGDELEILRAIARSEQGEADPREKEIAELRERLAALEAYMRRTDNDFFISQIHALREVPCSAGGTAREDGGDDREDVEGDGA